MAEKKTETKKTTGNTALDAVMSQIRKEFGEMSIMRLGDREIEAIPVIAGIRLRDNQVVEIDADFLRIRRIQRVFRVCGIDAAGGD